MDLTQMVILGAATAASSIITNGTAVGSGIFLLPVLALVFPAKTALGLGAPIMFVAELVGLRLYWREWDDWRDISLLLAAATLGIVLGSCVISIVPNHLFKIGIGIFVSCVSLYQLIKNSSAWKKFRSRRNSAESNTIPGKVACGVIGFLGGVATVLAHAGGAVWSTYYVRKRMDKRTFVATLILVFVLSNIFKMAAYLQIGILTTETTLIVLAMSPIVILSGMFGNFLNKRVNPVLFRTLVLLFILVSGISLTIGK